MARPDFDLTPRNVRQTLAALMAILPLALTGLPASSLAAAKTWSGSVSGDWTNEMNWEEGAVPDDGDDLVFPATAVRHTLTNEFPLFQARSLTFGGSNYVLHGNAIVLSRGIAVTAIGRTNTIHFGITCAANQTNSCVNTAAVLVINGNIDLGAGRLTVSGAGTNIYSGVISGSGTMIKNGTGLLRFQGVNGNTYSGPTTINAGLLQLAKTAAVTAVSGNLIVGTNTTFGTVRYLASDQVANGANITVNRSSTLDLNGFNDIVGALTLQGGNVQSGAGTLTIRGDVSVVRDSIPAAISGKLSLGGATRTFNVAHGVSGTNVDLTVSAVISDGGAAAGLVKTNTGWLRLTGTNTYSGQTRVDQGKLLVQNRTALGAAGASANGTVVRAAAILEVTGVAVGNEYLTLDTSPNLKRPAILNTTGVGSWAGPVELVPTADLNVTGTFTISGVISGTGGSTNIVNKDGAGTLLFSGDAENTYPNTTRVKRGMLVLGKSQAAINGGLSGNLVILGGGEVRLQSTSQLPDHVKVTVETGGLFNLNGTNEFFGSLAGGGNVALGSAWMQSGNDDESTTFNGIISGTGRFEKAGAGTMRMNGNNTYTGSTTVSDGTLLVNGIQPQSSVTVNNAILGGQGTVRVITSTAGVIAPGDPVGVLSSSNVVLDADSGLIVSLSGLTLGGGYGQLNVRGTCNLGGSILVISNAAAYVPVEGLPLVIVNNDGNDRITGTFAGLPEGATVTVGEIPFRISYVGGSGNDVTLTYSDVNAPLRVVGGTVVGGNGNGGFDANECNQLYLTINNATGSTLSNLTATLYTTTPHVFLHQTNSAYPDVSAGDEAVNVTPFELSTLPSYPCPGRLELVLVVETSAGSFASLVTFTSGVPGAPLPFDNNVTAAIPDVGTVVSTNVVSGVASPIAQLTLSLHLTHAYDGDLTNISLIGPDGTTVLLAAGDGGSGSDFGVGCPDEERTVFDDQAADSITAGTAPFAGSFQPRQSLAIFNGKSGTNVNGAWRLRISDGYPGSLGTLQCWSLAVAQTACADGGGYCAGCPGIVTNAISASTSTNDHRLLPDGIAASCGRPKEGCPGITNSAARFEVYTFNNASNYSACVTVTLDSFCPLFVSAYVGDFDPTNLCQNYKADLGSFSTNGSFSFDVPASSAFTVVVNNASAAAGNCDYALQVSGLDCPVSLNIAQVSNDAVRLFWSTSAGGYLLESVAGLASTNWSAVTNPPVVEAGSFTVTNSLDDTHRFYRLKKP